MGGSIRIPASWSGVVGLKPTVGRIPLDFLPSQVDLIHHVGPLARTIDDARAFLRATAGPSDRDLISLPAIDLDRLLDRSARGLRLALDVDLGCYEIDPQVEARVREAADALRAAGAEVVEVDLGWTRAVPDAWLAHWGVYLAAWFGDVLDEWREQMDPRLVALMDEGLALGAVEFKRLEIVRTQAWERLAGILQDHDALLCPTMSQAARPVEEDDAVWYAEFPDGRYRGLDLTAAFNFTSQCPVLSVPAGLTAEGLPVGLQIVARRYDDDLALRIGAAVEDARPWAAARPPL